MTGFGRALVLGAVGSGLTTAMVTAWVVGEPRSKLIVAAMPIEEGATITVSMLDAREVPTRFLSKRKLGVVHVAGVLGQQAPHSLRAGDFLDPTHFSERPDACVLDASSVARQLGVQGPGLDDFVARLGGNRRRASARPGDPVPIR
jgi:hypothetical protein